MGVSPVDPVKVRAGLEGVEKLLVLGFMRCKMAALSTGVRSQSLSRKQE
jgi:hypothetical protein